MKIIKVKPQGFCVGVRKAILDVNNLLLTDTPRPIYMFGHLVHNKYIVDDFENKEIIVLDHTNEAALDLIDSGTIIFTAHGVALSVKKKCLDKGLTVVDTTCKYVKRIHDRVIKSLNDGYNVFFLGIKNHPEANGVLGISDKVRLISFDSETTFPPSSTIITQSTLDYQLVNSFCDEIDTKNVHVFNEVCASSISRQKKAIAVASICELSIVVGDKSSNNCKSLASCISKYTTSCVVSVEDLRELKALNLDYSLYKNVAITSGASTPDFLVDEIYEYLKTGI